VISAAIPLPRKRLGFSVLGSLKDFIAVGIAAIASASIPKKIARSGISIIFHRTSPTIARTPQVKSSFVIFQYAFLLTKEAGKISKGLKPTMKVSDD
jgi:hypothetical protein